MVDPILEVTSVSTAAGGPDAGEVSRASPRARERRSPTSVGDVVGQGRSTAPLRRAAAIHAERFGRRRIVSVLALLTADRRIVVPGGVATLTAVPGPLAVATWIAASIGLFAMALAAGFFADHVLTVGAMLVAGATVAIVGGLAAERRVRVLRRWPGDHGSWVLADVAAERGTGGGPRVLGAAAALADSSSRPVVLAVRRTSQRARQLYLRHGFVECGGTEQVLRMRRPATGVTPPARTLRAVIGAIGLVIGGALTAVAAPSPVAWLVPPATLLLTAATVVDIEQLRIPNVLTGVGFVVLLGATALLQYETGLAMVVDALAGAGLFAAPLFVAHLVTAGRTPGLGDVKLGLSAGVLCGAFDVGLALPALVVSCVVGAAMGTVWQRRTGRTGFPLAPAIALGTAFVLLAGAAAGQVAA